MYTISLRNPWAIGALVATVLVGHLHFKRRGIVMYGALILSSVCFALLGVRIEGHALAQLALLACVGAGCGVVASEILWSTVLQTYVPQDMLGRVSSIDMVGSFALLPLGLLVVGILTDHLGAGTVFLLGGLCSVALAIIGLCCKSIRDLV